MRVDVSEIKTYKTCKRQWKLSSRNAFHLVPVVTPPQFTLGTMFHEALHSLYLGVSLDKVMQGVRANMTENETALLAMIPGYAVEVLPGDLERFQVLDIEHKFSIPCSTSDGEIIDPDIELCGSIDMIVVEKDTNKIYGFEHKTAKNFRDTSFLWMDEQPRVYTVALLQYIKEKNDKLYENYMKECSAVCAQDLMEGKASMPEEPRYYELGGIYINEVKKLLRKFSYQRTLCTYPADDLDNFMEAFFGTCCACKHSVDVDDVAAPSPGYFQCQLCTFKGICETYMYSTLDKETVLKEFEDEFVERQEDHLDEKVERVAENV